MLRHSDTGNTSPYSKTSRSWSFFSYLLVAAAFLSFFAECALRLLDDTVAVLLPQICEKSSRCGVDFWCYGGGASTGVIFTLFQKIILILVNTKEDLEDIFLAELIEVNPLRGSSCPLLWTVLSLKKVLVALKKVQIWANWS